MGMGCSPAQLVAWRREGDSMSLDRMLKFRERMKKLSKDELIDRMLNMKAFIDDLVEGSEQRD